MKITKNGENHQYQGQLIHMLQHAVTINSYEIYKKYTQISTQLLKKYIEMPYLNHLQTNSAYLQRNVNTEAFWLFANVMVPSITLLTELVMVLAIMLALFYIEPINTMILMCFFGVILFSIMTAIKRKMDVVGVASQSYFGEMVKSVNQSLGSIKLTKVSGTINYFLDNYQSNINYYANNTAFFKNISQRLERIIHRRW